MIHFDAVDFSERCSEEVSFDSQCTYMYTYILMRHFHDSQRDYIILQIILCHY